MINMRKKFKQISKKHYKNWKDFSKKKKFFFVFILIFGILFLTGIYSSFKPLPKGTNFEGPVRLISEEDIYFLSDLTYNLDNLSKEEYKREHEIFDKVFEIINNSQEFILIDMFLMGNSRDGYRNLSLELSQRLIEKKKENPEIIINFITDEFNTIYWSVEPLEIKKMKEAGINVIYTDMTEMRDSNLIYSPIWRVFFQVLGKPDFDCEDSFFKIKGKGVCLRSFLRMANAKANHRKVIVADNGNKSYSSVVTSANPDDWGSGYSNVGVYFSDISELARDIYFSEKAIADFSSGNFQEHGFDFEKQSKFERNSAKVQILTEGKIKQKILESIDNTVKGEQIDITMFLLTEQEIINSLVKASERGVKIRIVLDKSNDLFNRDSKGVPNCPAGKDLVEKSNGQIKIRWYNTGEQQFHSKLVKISKNNGKVIVFIGSANLTRRNIDNLNIEMVVKILIDSDSRFVQDIENYYSLIWNSKEGKYTVKYDNHSCSFFSGIQYRVQEATGFSAF